MTNSSEKSVRKYLYTWGLGKHGALGNKSTHNELVPLKIPLKNESASVVTCGGHCTGVVTEGGAVMTVGCGKYGRLGRGPDDQDELKFGVVEVEEKVVELSAGTWHMCAVSDKGEVFMWGYKKAVGRSQDIFTPIKVPLDVQIVKVSCGNNFTLALSSEGKVYSWGAGKHGVLGHGDELHRDQPEVIEELEGIKIVDINAGFGHCGVVSEMGNLYMFGKNEHGALGLKGKKGDVLVPTLVHMEERVGSVSCNKGEHHPHTLILSQEGRVYSCGDGYKGKLGLGDGEGRSKPTLIEGLEGVRQVAAGGIHSAALDKEGRVWTWGCGSDGRMGHPEAQGHRYLFREDQPTQVKALLGKVKKIDCSYYHMGAVMVLEK